MSFSNRVKLLVLIAALLPAIVSIAVSEFTAADSLYETNKQRLVAMRDVKSANLKQLFNSFKQNLQSIANVALQMHTQMQTNEYHQLMTSLNEQLGFYDIFVINPQGQIVYTVAREADYQTNLISGPYASSNLGKMFQQLANGNQTFVATDFEPYAPSNDDPAAFIGVPLQIGAQRWVIATQLSVERINAVMRERSGMGETGETYLVGSDYRMRSDSYLDPKGHSIQASFAGTVAKNGVTSDAVKSALSGQTSVAEIIDYNGNPVLSAYAPLDVYGMRWSILAEIDVAEIEQSTNALLKIGFVVLLLAAGFAVVAAIWLSRQVMQPIGAEPDYIKGLMGQLAAGDLSVTIKQTNDGSMLGSLSTMVNNLNDLLQRIRSSAIQLAATSDELTAITQETERNITSQSNELDLSASAVEELAVSIADVARSAGEAAATSDDANKYCQTGNKEVQTTISDVTSLSQTVEKGYQGVLELAQNVEKITGVLDVIQGIAEQTNLLALNAAIEAARAGENGRGFAVVADEVRNLAKRTQDSTTQIESMILEVTQKSSDTVQFIQGAQDVAANAVAHIKRTGDSLKQITQSLDVLQQQSLTVSTSTEQQATTATQVGESVVRIRDLATETRSGASQTAVSSDELNQIANELNTLVHNFTLRS